MSGEPIRRSPLDREFMEICANLIAGAVSSVYLIAGELGSLTYPQIQRAIYGPGKTRIRRYAYATVDTPQEIRNYALSIGFELYIGKEGLNKHYLVVDERHVIESLNKTPGKATVPGEREAVIYRDNPSKAEEVIEIFGRLKSDADRITDIEMESDPFNKLMH